MATGALSSAQLPQNTASTVLRAGEKVATSTEALNAKGAKTYKHMVPGARFIMPDGLEIHFLGGQFVTAAPDIIRELDAVANKTTSMIYTDVAAVDAVAAQSKQAAADAADTAGKPGQ